MGLVYKSMSKYSESLQYFIKSLKIRLKIFGENNVDTASSYYNIGGVFADMGKYTKILLYYKRSFKISHKFVDTASFYN